MSTLTLGLGIYTMDASNKLNSIYRLEQPASEQQQSNQHETNIVEAEKTTSKQTVIAGQIKEILGQAWIRTALIIGTVSVIVIGGSMILFSEEEQKIQEGRDGIAGVTINTKTSHEDILTKEQAQFLTEAQRVEAQRLAAEGKTNAPILTTFKGSDGSGEATQNTGHITPTVAPNAPPFMLGERNLADQTRYTKRMSKDGEHIIFYDKLQREEIVLAPTEVGRWLDYEKTYLGQNTDNHPLRKQQALVDSPARKTTFNQNVNNGNNTSNGNSNNADGGANGNGEGGEGVNVFVDDRHVADINRLDQRAFDDYDNYKQRVDNIGNQYVNQQGIIAENHQNQMQQRINRADAAVQSTFNRVQATGTVGGSFAPQVYQTPKSYQQKIQEAESSKTQNTQQSNTQPANNTGATTSKRIGDTDFLPRNVIRAGTSYTVVITKEVNTDNGNSVVAYIATGPLSGSLVHGRVIEQGANNIGVQFTSIQRPNPRLPLLSVNAVAENINGKSGVATSVNNHTVRNYAHRVVQSALRGYGDAYSNSIARTTVDRTDGSTVTSTDGSKVNSRQIAGEIAREFSTKIQSDFEKLGNKPTTYKIAAGTMLQMRITSDWDTTAVTSTL